jgi:hypothetical protein
LISSSSSDDYDLEDCVSSVASASPDGAEPDLLVRSSGSGKNSDLGACIPSHADIEPGLPLTIPRDYSPKERKIIFLDHDNYYELRVPVYEPPDDAVNSYQEAGDTPEYVGLIPTTTELPSGVVIDTDVEFWDLSDIPGTPALSIADDSDETAVDWEAFGENVFQIQNEILHRSVSQLHRYIDIIETAFITLSSSSFSGFLGDTPEAQLQDPLSQHVVEGLDYIQGAARTLNTPVLLDELASAQKRLSELRSTVSEKRKISRFEKQQESRGVSVVGSGRSPIATRSRGQVPDLPFVQPFVLEHSISHASSIKDKRD